MNIYLYTNIAASIAVFTIFLSALALENFTFKKISIKHITVMAMFAACSAVLTGLSNKIIIFGNIRISLGDWILFLLGLLFGPICGVVSAICTDTLMAIALPSPYGYHSGYMFNKCLLGFFGALVFLTKSENKIILKVILLYSISFIIQSLLLNQIWMMSWKGQAVWFDFAVKLIKLPFSLTIYIFLTISSFVPLKKLLKKWSTEYVWCFRSEYVNKILDY